jgi:predicted metal-dependent RNase
MDGVNFVDSPKTAITPAIATSGTSLTTGVKAPYVVDMTDLLMPYVRAVWKAYQADGTTSRNITAGAIKTTFCFGR